MPPSIGIRGWCGVGAGDALADIVCRTLTAEFMSPPSLEILRRRLRGRDRDRDRSSSSNVLCSSGSPWSGCGTGMGLESCESCLKAPRMVWVVVCRRRRGFIGGRGGVSMPLLRLAPGGRPTVGTFDVQEMKVGSEILVLSMERFWRVVCPVARWGRDCACWIAAAVAAESPAMSYNGGVALAEKGGAAGDGRGAPILGELAAGTAKGRS